MSRVLFESERRARNGDPWLSVRMNANGFYYSSRPGSGSVAFILIDNKRHKGYVGLYSCLHEPTNNRALRAFTGGMDVPPGISALDVLLEEVIEEAGYRGVLYTNCELVGMYEVSHQTDEMVRLYLVDVSEAEKGEPTTQDPNEMVNRVVWVGYNSPETTDWKALLAMAHYRKWCERDLVLCSPVNGQHGMGYRPVE